MHIYIFIYVHCTHMRILTLFKAVLCKTWLEEGSCARQGQGCQFAHGQKELGSQTGDYKRLGRYFKCLSIWGRQRF